MFQLQAFVTSLNLRSSLQKQELQVPLGPGSSIVNCPEDSLAVARVDLWKSSMVTLETQHPGTF